MLKIKILPLLALGITLFSINSCIAPQSPVENNGFFVSNNFNYVDSNRLDLYFSAAQVFNPMPTIIVNGRVPSISYNYPSSWGFSNIPFDSQIVYTISKGAQKLQGNFVIPPKIDSVFLNGCYVIDTGFNPVAYMDLQSYAMLTDSMVFTWKTRGFSSSYSISYSGQNIYNAIQNDVVNSARYVITSDKWQDKPFINFTVRAHIGNGFKNGTAPDVVDNGIYVYYNINGKPWSNLIQVRLL